RERRARGGWRAWGGGSNERAGGHGAAWTEERATRERGASEGGMGRRAGPRRRAGSTVTAGQAEGASVTGDRAEGASVTAGQAEGAGGGEGQAAGPPDGGLRGEDPCARAALEPFGFSAHARLSLLSLSENATYRVDDPGYGAAAVLRVHRTGYHPPGAVASELAWLQALRRDEGLLTPQVFAAVDGREVV